jgi:hypothetical protein
MQMSLLTVSLLLTEGAKMRHWTLCVAASMLEIIDDVVETRATARQKRIETVKNRVAFGRENS